MRGVVNKLRNIIKLGGCVVGMRGVGMRGVGDKLMNINRLRVVDKLWGCVVGMLDTVANGANVVTTRSLLGSRHCWHEPSDIVTILF